MNGEAQRSLAEILESLPKIQAAISAVVAGALPLLLPDQLVPAQLPWLRAGASICVVAAFLVGWAFQRYLRRVVGRLVVVAAGGAVGVVLLQASVVESLPDIGDPPETRHYLVGYSLTPVGDSLRQAVGPDLPRPVRLRMIGPDAIPQLYGTSFLVTKLAYVLSTVAFVTAAIVALTVAEVPKRTG